MTDTTAAEAMLEELLRDTATDPEIVLLPHSKAIAAVALRLARTLRRAALGKEPQVRGYHEPLCDQCCGCAARKALADWGTMLGEIASGRDA